MKIKIGEEEFTTDEQEAKDQVKLVTNDSMLNAQVLKELISTIRGLK